MLPVINGRRYGYRVPKPDARDYGLSNFGAIRALVSLPPAIDLEFLCGPVRDQGDEGSCTAHAGVGMREFLARKYQNKSPVLSPAFLYYMERLNDGDPNDDAGSDGRSMCKMINAKGICLEGQDPYVVGQWAIPPTPAQITEALSWTGGAYHQIPQNVIDLKSCLASGYAWAIGMAVFESFERTGSDGMVPPKSGSLLGYHEMLAIGYRDDIQRFKIRNSWGTSFGASGNLWLPYEQIMDPTIFLDAWIEHLGKPW